MELTDAVEKHVTTTSSPTSFIAEAGAAAFAPIDKPMTTTNVVQNLGAKVSMCVHTYILSIVCML